jgi:hypothetical protein
VPLSQRPRPPYNGLPASPRSKVNRTNAANVYVNVALWIISIGMGVAFAVAGATKLVFSKKRLALRGASWANDFSSGTVIFVGLTEITGGLAILAPVVLGIAPRLAVTAGIVGLIVVTVGAAVVHASRREPGMIVLNVALLALTAVALWNRPGY